MKNKQNQNKARRKLNIIRVVENNICCWFLVSIKMALILKPF